jgi:hypothetical protein
MGSMGDIQPAVRGHQGVPVDIPGRRYGTTAAPSIYMYRFYRTVSIQNKLVTSTTITRQYKPCYK